MRRWRASSRRGPRHRKCSGSAPNTSPTLCGGWIASAGSAEVRVLAMSQAYLGDPAAYRTKLQREREATPAKIQAAAKRWLSDGEYVAEVFPFGEPQASPPRGPQSASRDSPASRVAPAQARADHAFQRVESGSGRAARDPVISFSLLVDSGYAAGPGGALWAGTTGHPAPRRWFRNCSIRAPKTRTSLEIGEQLAQLRRSLNVGANMDGIRRAPLGSQDQPGRVSRNLRRRGPQPILPAGRFSREQKQQLASIEREKTEPVPLALRVLPSLIYGKGHAYSEPWNGLRHRRQRLPAHARGYGPVSCRLVQAQPATRWWWETRPWPICGRNWKSCFPPGPGRGPQEEHRHRASAAALRGLPDGSSRRSTVADSGGQRGPPRNNPAECPSKA